MMKPPEELLKTIEQQKHFTIASHINPEGDAIGSAIALAMALKQMGKEVDVFLKDPVPEMYRFMPGIELIQSHIELQLLKHRVFVIVDCNTPVRVGIEKDFQCQKSIVIDHHETLKDYGDIRWIEPSAAATGLMVFYLLKELKIQFTRDIATNLYVAIAVDTGTFRYDNTTSEVLRVAAELVDMGASPGWISMNIYESWSTRRFNLMREMLNTLEIYNSGPVKVAVVTITEDMFKKTGTDASDTDDFSNIARIMKDVNVSVLFRQDGPSRWKASMRSKGVYNVAKVARAFGGGGHRNAAGFIAEGRLEDIKKQVIEKLRYIGDN